MKNFKKNTKPKIINADETDFRVLSTNSAAEVNKIHTPEGYIDFATQTNEIIGHRRRKPLLITGEFLL